MAWIPKKYTVVINDDLDARFRKADFESKGMYRGNLTEALEGAMELWIKQQASIEK